jgi:nitrogen fixation NifU-like protein
MANLYRQQLMELYKNPQNKGKLQKPTVTVTGNNAICGDSVSIDLIVEENVIKDIKFEGPACAVSIASSSLLTEEVKGKSLDFVKNLKKEDVLDLLGVELTSSRIKCAILSLETIKEAVKEYESKKR